jgi:hypothetical protein
MLTFDDAVLLIIDELSSEVAIAPNLVHVAARTGDFAGHDSGNEG